MLGIFFVIRFLPRTTWSCKVSSNLLKIRVGGCGMEENVNHLFLGCDYLGSIWHIVRLWLCVFSLNLLRLSDHLIQLDHLGGFPKPLRSSVLLFWLSCIWVIWKELKSHIFQRKEKSLQHLFDKVKLLSLRWLKTKNVTLVFYFHNWWLNPSICLGFSLIL